MFPLLLATACGGGGGQEASPDAVAERLRRTLPAVLDPAAASMTVVDESTALASLGQSVDAMRATLALPELPVFGSDVEATALPADGDEEEEPLQVPDGEETAEDLIARIFNDENHEGDGVYRLTPELLCPQDDTGAIDPECAANVEAAELRIRVELAGDGLDFTLLVGPDRVEPLVLELRSDRLTVAVDLDEAADAATHLASVVGEPIALPDVFEGQVAFSIVVHGPEDVSFEIAVREDIAVAIDTEDGRVDFSTAARDPLASLRVDAAARALTALLDVGPTAASMPWQMANSASLATGTWAIDWSGLSFTASAQDGDDSVHIENIGWGDDTSTLRLDDAVLMAIDLNQSAGRRFAVTLSPDPAGGLPLADVTPGVELVVDLDLQPLASAGDPIDAWLLDDTYVLALEGPATTQSIAGDPVTGEGGALRIAQGSLTIANDGGSVVVEAGQCLLADPVTDGEHPILGAMTAGACP
jgi:hypothetical protein